MTMVDALVNKCQGLWDALTRRDYTMATHAFMDNLIDNSYFPDIQRLLGVYKRNRETILTIPRALPKLLSNDDMQQFKSAT